MANLRVPGRRSSAGPSSAVPGRSSSAGPGRSSSAGPVRQVIPSSGARFDAESIKNQQKRKVIDRMMLQTQEHHGQIRIRPQEGNGEINTALTSRFMVGAIGVASVAAAAAISGSGPLPANSTGNLPAAGNGNNVNLTRTENLTGGPHSFKAGHGRKVLNKNNQPGQSIIDRFKKFATVFLDKLDEQAVISMQIGNDEGAFTAAFLQTIVDAFNRSIMDRK